MRLYTENFLFEELWSSRDSKPGREGGWSQECSPSRVFRDGEEWPGARADVL